MKRLLDSLRSWYSYGRPEARLQRLEAATRRIELASSRIPSSRPRPKAGNGAAQVERTSQIPTLVKQ